jgi:hypothetical protein
MYDVGHSDHRARELDRQTERMVRVDVQFYEKLDRRHDIIPLALITLVLRPLPYVSGALPKLPQGDRPHKHK